MNSVSTYESPTKEEMFSSQKFGLKFASRYRVVSKVCRIWSRTERTALNFLATISWSMKT